jgi:peptidyl-prolyl cis-trans isomerase SurA
MQWKRWAAVLMAVQMIVRAADPGRGNAMVDGIAAIVDDAVITADDVNEKAYPALSTASRQVRNQEEYLKRRAEIWKENLESLIERQLILHDFKTAGYNIPQKFFDDYIDSEIRDRFGDRLGLIKTLHERNQTLESFRKDIKDTFIIRQMTLKNINEFLIISPLKIEKYYKSNLEKFQQGDRVKVRVIVLEKSKHGSSGALDAAKAARERIVGGEDFAKVADEVSDDARRNKGGDRGWVENKDSDLREELRKVAFASKPGEVSQAIDAEGAVFLIKVEERETAHLRTLAEARDEIEKTLKAQENERLRQKWINKLRHKALIVRF